jgi:6-phosphogluconolactonase (cycloisomerase 2 family)
MLQHQNHTHEGEALMRRVKILSHYLFLLVLLVAATSSSFAGPKPGPGNLLYLANNDPATGQNSILAYHRDPVTGCLTQFGRYPTGGTGFANPFGFLGPNDGDRDMIVNQDRTLLFSVNAGSNDISVFKIKADGSLDPVNGSPFPSGGSFPSNLILIGDLLNVTNMNAALDSSGLPAVPAAGQANYTVFRVSSTGHLSAVPHSTVAVLNPPDTGAGGVPIPIPPFLATGPTPTSMVASADGRFMFGTELFGNRIDVMSVQQNGRLTQVASVTPPVLDPPPPAWIGFVLPSVIPGVVTPNLNLPLNAATHPSKSILYVNEVAYTQIGVYTWDKNGALTYVRGALNAGPGLPVPGFAPCWNIISPNAKFMYVMNGLTNSVTTFSLADPLNPAPIQHLGLTGGAGGIRIVESSDGKFVYGLSHPMGPVLDSAIHVLKVNNDGSLTEDPTCSPVIPALPPGSLPQGIVVL